jgi:hypothetical protein
VVGEVEGVPVVGVVGVEPGTVVPVVAELVEGVVVVAVVVVLGVVRVVVVPASVVGVVLDVVEVPLPGPQTSSLPRQVPALGPPPPQAPRAMAMAAESSTSGTVGARAESFIPP